MKTIKEEKEKMRGYYLKNQERLKEKAKEYYYENIRKIKFIRNNLSKEQREKKRRVAREWYAKNKERVKPKKNLEFREYYKKNKEKVDNKNKKYYIDNKKKMNEKQKEYLKLPRVREKCRVREMTRYYSPIKGKMCEICLKNKARHRHHYTKPYQVGKFNYVCIKCHKEIHRREKDVLLEKQKR